MLLGRNFDDIDESTIQSLVDAGATESAHLEFKREIYGRSDNDKKELLKDISAFANSLGGHLIIGIEEQEGAARNLKPIEELDVDNELLRIENIVRTGLEPVILGLRIKRIDLTCGSVIVMQVPRSFNPPHRVIFKNSNRYYSRSSSGVREISLEELRDLFGQQRTIEERVKSFANERTLKVQQNDGVTTIEMNEGALVMHIVPLSDFGARRRIDLSAIRAQREFFWAIGTGGGSSRINLDGVCFLQSYETCSGYTQVFRDGSIESTTNQFIGRLEDKRFIASGALLQRLRQAIPSFVIGLKNLEASPPILLKISLLGVSNTKLALPNLHLESLHQSTYTRNELNLPETIISEYSDNGNYDQAISEQMNYLWNAFNYERCIHFDDEGKFIN